jgi:hypothetical protein
MSANMASNFVQQGMETFVGVLGNVMEQEQPRLRNPTAHL